MPTVSSGLADVAVAADLRLVVPAGVVAVGDVDHLLAVAFHVVTKRQTRHDRVGIDADDAAGGLAADALIAESESADSLGLIVQWSWT